MTLRGSLSVSVPCRADHQEGVRGPTGACREGREALDLPTLLRLQWSYMATRGRTRQQTATQAPVLAPGRNLPFLPASVSNSPGPHKPSEL